MKDGGQTSPARAAQSIQKAKEKQKCGRQPPSEQASSPAVNRGFAGIDETAVEPHQKRRSHDLLLLPDELNLLLGGLAEQPPHLPTRAALEQPARSLRHLEAECGGPIDIKRSSLQLPPR